MKSLAEILREAEEKNRTAVLAFGRMNPPTTGHMKLIDKVKSEAEKEGASHHIVISHSQDAKKNPLSAEQKLKHLQRYSPGTNFEISSKESPNILSHAARLHKAGHKKLIVVAGSDRVKEYHDLLHKYNGVEGKHGSYNFKHIEVRSSGERDPDAEGTEGMSATKMREHAKNNDFHSFRQGVPSHVSDKHAKELFHDVKHGMGLHEDVNRGKFKAIFVCGAPGSGKDIVIREAIAEQNAKEFDLSFAISLFNNKHVLAEETVDDRKLAFKSRAPLIINCPADKTSSISYIKEELEEFGYKCMMVFVDTDNETSRQRNSMLRRSLDENVRFDKWKKGQQNKYIFYNMFEEFNQLINNQEDVDLTEIYEHTTQFLDYPLDENNSPIMQFLSKSGKQDNVTDGDVKSNGDYTFKTYQDNTNPTLMKAAPPKVSNFSKDNNIDKEKKLKQKAISEPKVIRAPGVGPTYDNRSAQGNINPTSGLGSVTYKEDVDSKYNKDLAEKSNKIKFSSLRKMNEVAGTDPDAISGSSMGVGGTLGGSMNKMPMQTLASDNLRSGPNNKKKKLGDFKK